MDKPLITVLSGISGAGKTYRRTTDPDLQFLPVLDMADYHISNPGIDPFEALEMLLNDLWDISRYNPHVLVEGRFLPGSKQGERLERMAEQQGWEVRYIHIEATPAECIERLTREMKSVKGERERRAIKRRIESVRKLRSQTMVK